MNDLEFSNKMTEIILTLIGKKVVNKGLGEGTIVEVGNYVEVDFNGTIKTMTKDKFFDYNRPIDTSILNEVETAKNSHDEYLKEQRIEAAKRDAELAEKRRKEIEERKKLEGASRRKPNFKKSFDEKFGADYNLALLKKTPVLSYKNVEAEHTIHISRGICPKNDRVVLISTVGGNSDHFTYHDKWNHEGHYEFSGEGSTGDQTLTKGNKAIIDAAESGKPIYLYVKFGPQKYYPQGIMKLLEYKTIQAPDKNGDMRKEYVFIFERV